MILFGPKVTVFLVGKSAEIRLDKAEKNLSLCKEKDFVNNYSGFQNNVPNHPAVLGHFS
jgi:hypothetical protein